MKKLPCHLVVSTAKFVVRLLLKDPRVDVTLDDDDGRTPLWNASCRGHIKVIECLIASGRDLADVKNKRGKWADGQDYTALEIAIRRDKREVVLCWKDL